MAFKIGIVGDFNTGKSYARKFIERGEDVFVLAPSAKALHITDSSGVPLKHMDIEYKEYKTLKDLQIKMGTNTIHELIPTFLKKPAGEFKITGNYVRCTLYNIGNYLELIDKYMPHIKTIIIPDFTHFLSAIMANKAFIQRKAGGEAFQRFWELAGDTLEKLILSQDDLREDLVVITEYHCEYDEVDDDWKLFVPGGKMLQEKFKLASYYDFMLYTYVNKGEEGIVTPDSYKFVTKRWKQYPARFAELFEDTLIPNNLQRVLDKFRVYNGI